MKVDERALKDVHTVGGGETPPCVGLTSNTLPKAQSTVSAESSQTGVSTRNAHMAVKPKVQKEEEIPGQRIFLVGMMGKALAHIRHIE